MGYVTGARCGPHREKIPPDWAILAEVVDGCLLMPDLYPAISDNWPDDSDGPQEAT